MKTITDYYKIEYYSYYDLYIYLKSNGYSFGICTFSYFVYLMVKTLVKILEIN